MRKEPSDVVTVALYNFGAGEVMLKGLHSSFNARGTVFRHFVTADDEGEASLPSSADVGRGGPSSPASDVLNCGRATGGCCRRAVSVALVRDKFRVWSSFSRPHDWERGR